MEVATSFTLNVIYTTTRTLPSLLTEREELQQSVGRAHGRERCRRGVRPSPFYSGMSGENLHSLQISFGSKERGDGHEDVSSEDLLVHTTL